MFSFAALISGAFSLGGRAAPYIDPAAINAVRFALAVLVMAIFVNQTASWKRDHARAPWRYLVMGFLLSLYFVLMFRALQITDPVSTGAVFTLTPLMSAGFGWLFLRQVSRPAVLLALLVGAAGAVWVIFRGDVSAMLGFRIGPGHVGERVGAGEKIDGALVLLRPRGGHHPRVRHLRALPVGPMLLMVHIASVWVPFTSESKEAIANYPEIIKEMRLALQEAGRRLQRHIRRRAREKDAAKKQSYIQKYIPHIGDALQEILALKDAEREEIIATLTDTLERSRKL